MKFALFDGKKIEAVKGIKGICPSCGAELIAKCGPYKVNHWAHKGSRACDPWWENETEWHRSWKGKFPVDWQEVVHFDGGGEKHIADVKTQSGWILEFQHSYLNPEERRSRNAFYSKLVWVVDGTRRKTDIPQFDKLLKESVVVTNNPPIQIWRTHFPEEYRLLREWHGSNALVFFDFQAVNATKQTMLWFIFPKIASSEAYISTFPRGLFIDLHNENKFGEIIKNTIFPIHQELVKSMDARNTFYENSRRARLSVLDQHIASKRRRHKRL